VLKKGLIRRIGNGESTRTWEDRWIPNHFNGLPLTLHADHGIHFVSDLLTSSGQWNADLINQIFFPVDVVAILKIPLRTSSEDCLAWEPEKHGLYSVKSAYKLLFTGRQQESGDIQASSSGDPVWRKLWKIEVPPKVRVFWWRVLHGFLPTKHTLYNMHIERLPNCGICRASEESIKHVLMECTVARIFWWITKDTTAIKIPKLQEVTWARDLLDGKICSRKDAAIILCGMWSLWMQRNKRCHGEASLPIQKAVQWVRDTTSDLWHIMHNREKKCQGAPKRGVKIYGRLVESQPPVNFRQLPSLPVRTHTGQWPRALLAQVCRSKKKTVHEQNF
jgi:hypothetical protein